MLRLHDDRSMRAGVETPATLRTTRTSRRPHHEGTPLNEGRGRNPGNTGHIITSAICDSDYRSMRAGVETPATPRGDVRTPMTQAIPRLRSMRAGVETPATLLEITGRQD